MKIANVLATSLVLVATITTSVQSQISSKSLANGKRLFATNCANCHGDAAQGAVKAGFEISIITERGGKQPPSLIGGVWGPGSSDAKMIKMIKEGVPANMMPSFQGRFSNVEMKSLVSYIRSLAAPKKVVKKTVVAAPVNTQARIELADYLELPITGDGSADRVSGVLARGSILRDEPGTNKRSFINDLTGPLYILDKQTKKLTTYLNFSGLFPKFTAAQGYATGLMNFEFDPDYARNGIFYTLHMENANLPGATAVPKDGVVPGLNLTGYSTTAAIIPPNVPNPGADREMVIIEWTDQQITNNTFEGTALELLRMQLPGIFHPLNEMIFNPVARPGDPEWRVMYLGIGDAGTGERQGPMRMYAQRLDTYQGKVLRIIPKLDEHISTSTISENGRYRIPNDNPFVSVSGAKKEVWALGLRNPHRLTWYIDPARPKQPVLLAFNIGLVSSETIMIVKKGANYGYPLREGSLSMSASNGMGPLPAQDIIPVMVTDSVTQGSVKPEYAVVAYPHAAGGGDAIANGFVYRGKRIPELKGCLVFGDVTTGRIWYSKIKDVLAADDGNPVSMAPIKELNTNLRQLSEETYRKRGGRAEGLPGRGAIAGAGRIDLRLAEDHDGELYLLTKGDGMIREIRSVKLL